VKWFRKSKTTPVHRPVYLAKLSAFSFYNHLSDHGRHPVWFITGCQHMGFRYMRRRMTSMTDAVTGSSFHLMFGGFQEHFDTVDERYIEPVT